jgi:hypothetical protein
MARKPIPSQTETNIFQNSRRRCCLCFWLKGEDEVKKGQIAHLDQDNENNAESNLVFLCFVHHDEYDSTTRQSKGFSQPEVKRWRDELYREMKYRFRMIKTRSAELSLVELRLRGNRGGFTGRFRVKNTGDAELRQVVVALRVPDGVRGTIPPHRVYSQTPSGLTMSHSSVLTDMWAASEDRQDFFEPGGRVCVKGFGPMYSLMPGHSEEFDALLFHLATTKPGDSLTIEYRIDAEEMSTASGAVTIEVPKDAWDQSRGADEVEDA